MEVIPALVGLITATVTIHRSKKHEICLAENDNYRSIRERLSAYAMMKNQCATLYHPPTNSLSFVPSGMMLASDQHDILLGVLKKIEAKSTVMVVLVVFTLPFLFSQTNELRGDSEAIKFLVHLAAGILGGMLLVGADGAAHIGQPHFREYIEPRCCFPIRGRELQRTLIHDMLGKEAAFNTSFSLAKFLFILFALIYIGSVVMEP